MTINFKEKKIRIRRWFVKKYFKDVMDNNSRKYLGYLEEPTKGLTELQYIAKNRLLDDLENQLKNGITNIHLYDKLFDFYKKTPFYDFTSMHYELTNYFLETIVDFEQTQNILVDKERLFFLRALCQISSSNTIGAMASWELANREKMRTTGTNISILDLISDLPERTIINPIDIAYRNNLLVKAVTPLYPSILNTNFKDIINTLTGLDAISFLSCGLRNVQVASLIQSHNNSLELNKIFAQEIINNLCILNESTIKDYPEVQTTITRKKDRQLGKMLSPSTLSIINSSVSTILGSSVGCYTGLYSSINLLDDNIFNTQYPAYINKLCTTTLSVDEFKAHVLLGIHALRNKVLHDHDETLCYFSDTDLFIKTIGLLLIGVSVTKKIK
jgi:hypothetical protein